MKVFLNGKEMQFVEGGYKYVFMKPCQHVQEKTVDLPNGNKMHFEIYDNGVQIRTLISKEEVATIVNRDVAVDTKNNQVYVLEEGNEYRTNPDGSVDIIK